MKNDEIIDVVERNAADCRTGIKEPERIRQPSRACNSPGLLGPGCALRVHHAVPLAVHGTVRRDVQRVVQRPVHA